MQNKKQKLKVFITIVTFALAIVFFIGTGVSVVAQDEQKTESIVKDKPEPGLKERDKKPVKKEIQKDKAVKAPRSFVPTDKVSADQAVAFPTDI